MKGFVISNGFEHPAAADYLAATFPDRPLSLLPPKIIIDLCQRWKQRDDIFFLVAETGGNIQGYALAQTVGMRSWRKLLLLPKHLPTIALAFLKYRIGRFWQSRLHRSDHRDDNPISVARAFPPFATVADEYETEWQNGVAAIMEFTYVAPENRGNNLGQFLLDATIAVLKPRGIVHCYAYVDPKNTASIQMLTKSGWVIYAGEDSLRSRIRVN